MIDVAVIGAGNRGSKYARILAEMKDRVTIAAIVEPNAIRREAIARIAPDAAVFDSFGSFLASGLRVRAAVISTPEALHRAQAVPLIEAGVNILVEKPLAPTRGECEEILETVRRHKVVAGVCHVLRYHPYFEKMHEIAASGRLGEIVSITHRVNVGIDRACHTFVRGPWGRTADTSPLLLGKCCHDTDFIAWLVGSPCTGATAVGGRRFFCEAKAPQGSAHRCIDCSVEAECPYSAVDLYRRRRQWTDNFDVAPGESLRDAVERQLVSGEYGRCVFHCDNDTVDRQALLMEFESGAVATLTLNLFTADDERDTHICLTGGEIRGNGTAIQVIPLRGEPQLYEFRDIARTPYHAGADIRIILDFIAAIESPGESMLTSLEQSFESHRICFTALIAK